MIGRLGIITVLVVGCYVVSKGMLSNNAWAAGPSDNALVRRLSEGYELVQEGTQYVTMMENGYTVQDIIREHSY